MVKSFTNIFFFFLILITSIHAQEITFEHFKAIKARNIGPAGMSGRVTAIDVNLRDQSKIYVGTASGGVWLSENGGISWEPIFDKQNTLSIGALKINQSNPNEIWVGTGEGNPRNSQNSGAGVYKSVDAGKTWKLMGLTETKVIHRIAIDESRDGVVYIGAQGSAWGKSMHRGVYKTIDGGQSWQKSLYVNEGTGIADMVMDPHNPNKIIAAMWEFNRTPAFFNSGGPGSGLYITYDGGDNWKEISAEEGLPKGDLGRIGLAISRSQPDIIYAIVEAKDNALYKSIDGGAKWNKVGAHENMGNRPFYYSEIYVDPLNENRIYSLWSYLSRSDDGGKTFRVIADYGNSVHPDHHAFWVHPDDPSYLIDGNDGGLNISHDMGDNWRFVNNLPVGQFYHVNVDDDFPYNVYGGMQDNGSWVGPGFSLKRGGINNHDWQEVYFGDGFDVAPRPDNNRYVYAMSQGGNIGIVDRETGMSRFIKPNSSDTIPLRFNWNAPLALQPNSDCGLYYGSQFVHFSNDCGESWTIISPDLTTNDTSKQHQDISGGLTIDATNAENNTTLITIAPSSVDSKVIWAGSDDGRLHITKDGGDNWSDVYNRLPQAPEAGWIPQIRLSQDNAGEAWVVVNNYRQNDWSAYLYHTTNYGMTWSRKVDDSQVKGFVTSFIQDKKEPNLLFLGTDIGLYISFDGGSYWHHWTEGMPPVQIRDMAIQETFDDLVFGTFGRAFWIIDDIGAFRSAAQSKYYEKEFALASVSPAYLSEYRSYQGIRFYGQGEFIGDNKGTNPTFSIWVNPPQKTDSKDHKESKSEKKGKDKISFVVMDMSGDTIRRFSRNVSKEGGLQRISWNLRKDGVQYPSRREAKPDADPPSGGDVLPGTYKVNITYKDHSDSTILEVKMDPRIDLTASEIAKKKGAISQMEQSVSTATAAFKRIQKAKKSLGLIDQLIATVQDTTKKELSDLSKKQKKSLEQLEELFMDKQGLKGIQRNPNNLNAYLRTGMRYLNSSIGVPNPNAQVAIDRAKNKVNEVNEAVEAYFKTDWSEFRGMINKLDFELFDQE